MSFLVFWLYWGFLSWGVAMIYRSVEKYLRDNPKDGIASLARGIGLCIILGPLVIPAMLLLTHYLRKFDGEDKDIES